MSDAFWKIAMMHEPEDHRSLCDNDSTDDYEDTSTAAVCDAKTYALVCPPFQPVRIRLAPLPLEDGVWSALGSQAWYGSALLAALLFVDGSLIRRHLGQWCKDQHGSEAINALELGSGAVGLSGIALSLLLAAQHTTNKQQPNHRVTLSDNEPEVLQQLERNIRSNVERIQTGHPEIRLPEITVSELDWNDELNVDTSASSCNQLQLAIGSELVYTKETAHACYKVCRALLRNNQDILVAIVQVSDRDGWKNDFLPRLRQEKGIVVEEEAPIRTNATAIHEFASKLIRQGGTLDSRFDFSVCYISNIADSRWC